MSSPSSSTFFVCGFPRSRTAWLANLFTLGNSICLHDELANHETIDGFANHLCSLRTRYDRVGVSDSALILFREPIEKHFPGAKWLVILRDRKDAEAAFLKAFTAEPISGFGAPNSESVRKYFDAIESAMERAFYDRFYKDPNFLAVSFEDLEVEQIRNEACAFIEPDISAERIEMLESLRITQIPPKRNVNASRIMKLASTLQEGVLA